MTPLSGSFRQPIKTNERSVNNLFKKKGGGGWSRVGGKTNQPNGVFADRKGKYKLSSGRTLTRGKLGKGEFVCREGLWSIKEGETE